MNSVESILLNNIDNSDSLFVFPTDTAASRWADHLLRKKRGSVAMNKFIAWDDFKQDSIRSQVQKKKSVPSALRKIFIERLIKENSELAKSGQTPVFSSLIKPKWASSASQFSPWLNSVLPQLKAWFLKTANMSIGEILTEQAEKAASGFEGDYRDMFILAKRYAQFLDDHSLFEPAWETPPFNDEGKDVFIFFPESLSDYNEYEQILKNSKRVKTIKSDSSGNISCDSFFYTNSRSEITEAALYIRALRENQGIEWDSIAVCICDPDSYEPYVLREFENRNIPFTKRTSKPLSDFPAGRFFRSVLDCASQNFSFSSVVSLIMNKKLPWKKNNIIEELIEFGINNNCLYSWSEDKNGLEKQINVWEDAFTSPYGNYEIDIKHFFNKLKNSVLSFRHSSSFAELRKQYFIFREQFFDMEKCPEETDLILSRCISELMNLTELEKSFPDVPAADPFVFFTEYLSEVYYLPQSKSSGVVILPYKTAAAAPFDCHIILNSSQESLSVVYSHLDFLPRKKREEIGLGDEDVSSAFINMHKNNSVKIPVFFCSERTFSGFAIPHSKTQAPYEPRNRYASDEMFKNKFSQDYYDDEKKILSSFSELNESGKLHKNQINGFKEWKERRISASSGNIKTGQRFGNEIQKIIKNSFAKTGKYSVSATSLQKYYQCSLKWLFERVFSLENAEIESSLMSENISGLVYHSILNNFFSELKENILPEPDEDDSGLLLPVKCKKLLEECVNNTFNLFPRLKPDGKPEMSSLTARLLNAGKNDYQYNLEKALANFFSFFHGCSVYGTEKNYNLDCGSYIMNGFVDLILKNKDEYIIVDFKLKNMPLRSNCAADDENPLADFQLPMYITLAQESEKIKVYTALFYSIIDTRPEVIIGAISGEINDKTITPESERYKKLFEEFNSKKDQFINEISSGNFSVFPDEYSGCADCDYHRICRTVYVINRENIITGKY